MLQEHPDFALPVSDFSVRPFPHLVKRLRGSCDVNLLLELRGELFLLAEAEDGEDGADEVVDEVKHGDSPYLDGVQNASSDEDKFLFFALHSADSPESRIHRAFDGTNKPEPYPGARIPVVECASMYLLPLQIFYNF